MQHISYRLKFHTLFLIILISAVSSSILAGDELTPVRQSSLAGIDLPAGAARVGESSIPAEVNTALEKIVAAGGDEVRPGEHEVLAWTEGFKRPQTAGLIKQLAANLQNAGWTYEVGGEDQGVTVFSVFRTSPQKRALIGFYSSSNDALVIAWTELLPADAKPVGKPAEPTANPPVTTNTANTGSGAAAVVNVGKDAAYINIMGSQAPPIPTFPALEPKPGKVRGYVKDTNGKPIAGAALGVRSTAVGGFYSGSQGTTDAKGYYEFAVPAGVAHFYNAGVGIDWGEGLAALGLHPADGKVDSFASTDGAVENFVLMPYGITSRENLSDSAHLPATYYGGALFISYWTREATDNVAPPKNFVQGSTIDIILTSDGPSIDGSPGRSFVVRKVMGYASGFRINNIPVGKYKISARLGSKPLKLRLNQPKQSVYGMFPAETTSDADLIFFPSSPKASMVSPGHGGWDAVSITVEMP